MSYFQKHYCFNCYNDCCGLCFVSIALFIIIGGLCMTDYTLVLLCVSNILSNV